MRGMGKVEPAYVRPRVRGRDGSASGAPVEVHRAEGVVVTRVDSIDFGGGDGSGGFAYVYRFATYEVRVGGRVLGARRYADTWGEVAIFPGGAAPSRVPYEDAAFVEAARYFLALEDVARVTVLVGAEYRVVEAEAVLGRRTP
jgi:hypothetical protein